ncbi:MAG: glycosyltransferase, partial [Rhodospirillales bacterium]|nr:glycosyltransferase [Rhodospirillales bacterium]
FEQPQDCGEALARLCWYFRAHADAVAAVDLFASFQSLPGHAPAHIDPGILTASGSQALLAKTRLAPPPADRAAWEAAIRPADLVLVWRQPDGGAFETLEDLAAAVAVPIIAMDETRSSTVGRDLAEAALSLAPPADTLVEDSKTRLEGLKSGLGSATGYIAANGRSLQECARLDLSEGRFIVCNDRVIDTAWMEAHRPLAVVVGGPSFYAGPSRYAAAYRVALARAMEIQDFWLVVPLRDYRALSGELSEAAKARVIAVPSMAELPGQPDLAQDFKVVDRPAALTHLLLPLAAYLFDRIEVCGCDGVATALADTPWPRLEPAELADEKAALLQAAPALTEMPTGKAYLEHCKMVGRLCKAVEKAGKTVVGLTASHVPALRARGAAEPVVLPPAGVDEHDPVVLSMTPDLKDKIGHFWNYEMRLGPKVEAGGLAYRIASNAGWKTVEGDGEDPNEVDASLLTFSWTLANKPGETQAYIDAVGSEVLTEFSAAVDRVLKATPGRVHIYMYCGSLEHAAVFYRILRLRPRVSAHVNLFWFRTVEAWKANFLKQWMWLLQAAERDPRLTITCMTAHQRCQIMQRSGVALPVAAHPSPLIGDERALALLGAPPPERATKRVFFPSTNRSEKGSGILYKAALRVVELMAGEPVELVFRTSPFPRKGNPAEDPLYPYVTLLEGHIEEGVFIETLRSCSAVVLPYLPPDFADRTSGIAIDALYAGTPSVVMRGTFLAEVARKYGSGIVVDRGTPAEVARAVVSLLKAEGGPLQGFRSSAMLYFQANSWQRLAQEIIDSRPGPETAPLVDPPSAAGAAPVALLGPLEPDQAGRVRPLEALRALLHAAQGGEIFALLEARQDQPLQLVSAGGKGLSIAASAYAAERASARLKEHPPELATRMHVEALASETGLTDQVQAYCTAAGVKAVEVMVGNDPALAGVTAGLIGRMKPKAAALAFDDGADTPHAVLAKQLTQEGYLVCLAEDHPQIGDEEAPAFRRLAAYPMVSDLPWARGHLLALPAGTALPAVAAAVLESGENLAYEEVVDPQEKGLEIWEAAEPPRPGTVLVSAGHPNSDWQLAGLEMVEKISEDFFALLTETPSLRVHRSAIKGHITAGQPLTVSIDLVARGRRFVTLWLTDAKNRPRAEAMFDLDDGQLLRSSTPVGDVESFAAAVPIGADAGGSAIYRAWISIKAYPQSEEVHGQIVTRAAADGSLLHLGEADKGVKARRFLMEMAETPSLYPAKGGNDK